MAINFFQAQENARRRSRWLVVWFAVAVVGVVLTVYVLAVAGLRAAGELHGGGWWFPEVAATVTAAALAPAPAIRRIAGVHGIAGVYRPCGSTAVGAATSIHPHG